MLVWIKRSLIDLVVRDALNTSLVRTDKALALASTRYGSSGTTESRMITVTIRPFARGYTLSNSVLQFAKSIPHHLCGYLSGSSAKLSVPGLPLPFLTSVNKFSSILFPSAIVWCMPALLPSLPINCILSLLSAPSPNISAD